MNSGQIPFRRQFKNQEGWLKAFRDAGALRIPERQAGSVLVRLGKLEKATFDLGCIANDHTLMRMAASDLILQCLEAGGAVHAVSRVVGPLAFCEFVASELRYHKSRGRLGSGASLGCGALPFEEVAQMGRGEVALLVEEALDNDYKTKLALKVARVAEAELLPFVLTLVNLSGQEECAGGRVLSLVSGVE